MTLMRRIVNIIIGLGTIAFAFLIMFLGRDGLLVVMAIFEIGLLVYGIYLLFYYFIMARHMVGGQLMLFLGLFVLGLSTVILKVTQVPERGLAIIVAFALLLAGGLDIVRSFEIKTRGSQTSWRFTLVSGIIEAILSLFSLIIGLINPAFTAIMLGLSFLYSGVSRVVAAFRRYNWMRVIKRFKVQLPNAKA